MTSRALVNSASDTEGVGGVDIGKERCLLAPDEEIGADPLRLRGVEEGDSAKIY
jgi:hypothetical protein